MKKFVLSLMIVAVFGTPSKVNAQCGGGSVAISNFTLIPAIREVQYNFTWNYLLGNASIQVRFLCNDVEVGTLPCIQNLMMADRDNPGPHNVSGTYPLTCVGTFKMEIVIWSSPDCGGNSCVIDSREIANIPAPVNFKSVDANRNRSNVLVKWETASEQDNAGFNVQRNIGGTWQNVAYVPSQATGGNSDAVLTYTFNDLNPTKGITQYRIQQVDLDGKNKFSEIRAVRGEGQIGRTVLFPNPSSNGNVSIVFEDANVKRDVTIIDLTGKVIKQWRNVTNNNLQVENLPTGMFSVRILAVETGEQVVEKIMVNKR